MQARRQQGEKLNHGFGVHRAAFDQQLDAMLIDRIADFGAWDKTKADPPLPARSACYNKTHRLIETLE